MSSNEIGIIINNSIYEAPVFDRVRLASGRLVQQRGSRGDVSNISCLDSDKAQEGIQDSGGNTSPACTAVQHIRAHQCCVHTAVQYIVYSKYKSTEVCSRLIFQN
jgi:hypothetical protein